MRIGSAVGLVMNGASPPPPAWTPRSLNSGSTWATGVSTATLPSSTSIMKATEVTGLVMLAMRKREPSSICLSEPARAAPWLLKWTISPSRLISSWAWGSLPVSRYCSLTNASMRFSRAPSKPYFSGDLIGSPLPGS